MPSCHQNSMHGNKSHVLYTHVLYAQESKGACQRRIQRSESGEGRHSWGQPVTIEFTNQVLSKPLRTSIGRRALKKPYAVMCLRPLTLRCRYGPGMMQRLVEMGGRARREVAPRLAHEALGIVQFPLPGSSSPLCCSGYPLSKHASSTTPSQGPFWDLRY